jgi:hypothetical protein
MDTKISENIKLTINQLKLKLAIDKLAICRYIAAFAQNKVDSKGKDE